MVEGAPILDTRLPLAKRAQHAPAVDATESGIERDIAPCDLGLRPRVLLLHKGEHPLRGGFTENLRRVPVRTCGRSRILH